MEGGGGTIPSSFNYIPLIKVQNGSTHHMCGTKLLGLIVTSTFLTSWVDRFLGGFFLFVFSVFLFFLLLVFKSSSECTHTA